MTIAGCYLTAGGLVLGADSTQTIYVFHPTSDPVPRFFDHAQKLFEVGEESTLGVVTWGFGGSSTLSYRTLLAELWDDGLKTPFHSVRDVADRWASQFWNEYSTQLAQPIARVHALKAMSTRSPNEDAELENAIANGTVGFCLGGYVLPNRRVEAYELIVQPDQSGQSTSVRIQSGQARFWGMPNIFTRITSAIDPQLANNITQSLHWNGTMQDLIDLIRPYTLSTSDLLPIREAVDYVHSVIYATCKGLKFSQMAPACGGPVEIGVITTDRRFRWVRHKTLAEAIERPSIP